MQQKSFFKSSRKAHGGHLSLNKRRCRRPINIRTPFHIVLRSDLAKGSRSLIKHKILVRRVMQKASKKFGIQVYKKAICGNHIHMLIRGKSKPDIQNFFRVLAGHVAQEILRQFPLLCAKEWGGAPKKGCKKNQRKFWSLLLYSRVVSWGRDFSNVTNYIIQNTLEALNLIPYQPRKAGYSTKKKLNTS